MYRQGRHLFEQDGRSVFRILEETPPFALEGGYFFLCIKHNPTTPMITNAN